MLRPELARGGCERREFIGVLRRCGGVAAHCAGAAARADAADRRARAWLRRGRSVIGQPCIAAFLQGLAELGGSDGRNVRIDYSLGARPMSTRARRYAAELVALAPDVILANCHSRRAPLLQATRTDTDRVRAASPIRSAAGLSPALARPGGNVTGFINVRIRHGGEMAGAAQSRSRPA